MTYSLKFVGIAVFLVCLLGIIIFLGTESEERKINKRRDKLIALNEKSGQENKLNSVSKARKISNYFTANCQIDLPYGRGTVEGRDLLTGSVIQLRAQSDTISLSLRERSITLATNELSANMKITVKVSGDFTNDKYSDLVDIYLEWDKIDKDWLIDRVSLPESNYGY